jgi:hypothetical protein
MDINAAKNKTKTWDGINYDRRDAYVAGSLAAGGFAAHKTLKQRISGLHRSTTLLSDSIQDQFAAFKEYLKQQKAENQLLKASLTKEELLIGHAIRTGIALSAITLTMSAAYMVHPYTPMDVLNAGKAAVKTVSTTVQIPINAYREYSERRAADKAAKLALIEQERAELRAKEQVEAHLAASGADGNPTLYGQDADGNMVEMMLPETLHYVYNDYNSILDTSMGSMLYFSQGDTHWNDYLIAGVDRMGGYGCGPVTISMLVNSFAENKEAVTPIDVAEWAVENNEYAIHGGSYHSLIPNALAHYGLNCESVQERTPEKVRELLRTGHVLIALMGKGSLTDVGHFVIITQNAPDGGVMIADPAKFGNCQKSWDLDLIIKELKAAYDAGGPLWSVTW